MPKVFEWRGYRFFFYAYEGKPREPVHIHVRKDGCEAKFWLRPFVSLARSRGFTDIELRKLSAQVRDNRERIEQVWNEFFES